MKGTSPMGCWRFALPWYSDSFMKQVMCTSYSQWWDGVWGLLLERHFWFWKAEQAHRRRYLHIWEIEPLEFSWSSEYPLVKMGQIALYRTFLFCHLPSLLSVSPRTQPSVHSLGCIHFSPCLLRQWTQFPSTSVSLASPRLTCPGFSPLHTITNLIN